MRASQTASSITPYKPGNCTVSSRSFTLCIEVRIRYDLVAIAHLDTAEQVFELSQHQLPRTVLIQLLELCLPPHPVITD